MLGQAYHAGGRGLELHRSPEQWRYDGAIRAAGSRVLENQAMPEDEFLKIPLQRDGVEEDHRTIEKYLMRV